MAELTGRKVAAITVSAFAVIIGVNLLLAWKAVSTFPGLEVQNGYIASQSFDADRAAQKALGWTLVHGYAGGKLTLDFRKDGMEAPVVALDVLVGRPTEAKEDQRPVFVDRNGVWEADVALRRGKWMMMVEAKAPDGTVFRQRLDLVVDE